MVLIGVSLFAVGWLCNAPEGAAQASTPSTMENCAGSPTAECVMAQAIETAEAIGDPYVRSSAFVLIAEAQSATGDAPGAQKSLSWASAAAAAIEDFADVERPTPPMRETDTPQLPLCGERPVFYSRNALPYPQARALIDIAQAQVATGDKAGAQRTLLRMLAATDGIEEPHHRAAILCDISATQKSAGDDGGAQESLSMALAATDQIASDESKLGMLSAIAEAQGSAGELQSAAEIMLKAREIYARIGDAGDYTSSFGLRRLAAAQVKAGDIESAFVTSQVIGDEEDYGRALALGDIAHALAAAGDVTGAFATEERVWGAYLQIVVVTDVGLALAEAGDIAGATGAATRITEIEEKEWWDPVFIAADIHRSVIFRAIVKAHVAAGAFNKALDALEKIQRGYQIVGAAITIAKAQIAAGDLDAAWTTADTVCEFRHRNDRCVEILADLASALASVGNLEQAQELIALGQEQAEWWSAKADRFGSLVFLWEAQTRLGSGSGAREAFAAAFALAEGNYDVDGRVEELTTLGVAAARMARTTEPNRRSPLPWRQPANTRTLLV